MNLGLEMTQGVSEGTITAAVCASYPHAMRQLLSSQTEVVVLSF